ncbi:MAG: four helix bundle protein [Bacteroidales bacterium]
MRDFRQYKVWKESHNLTLRVYKVTSTFPSDEKFALIPQMRRAAYSIPSNIAEGCGRDSDKDFNRFLQIATGSINELEYFIILAKDLALINDRVCEELEKELNILKSMLYNLSCKLKESYTKQPKAYSL